MFRLFKAELKKIFLKPSIFVVTGLIILMLAVSTFIYKPTTMTQAYYEYPYHETIKGYYDDFVSGNNLSYEWTKDFNDARINEATAYVNAYVENTNVVQSLRDKWTNIYSMFEDSDDPTNRDYVYLYRMWSTIRDEETEAKAAWKQKLDSKKIELETAIQNFKTQYNTYTAKEETFFLVSNNLYNDIEEHFDKIFAIFLNSVDKVDQHGYIKDELKNYGAISKVFKDIDGLLPFEPSEELINQFKTTKIVDSESVANEESPIVIAQTRLDDIWIEIENYNNDRITNSSASAEEKKEFCDLLNQYCSTAKYAHNVITYGIKVNGFAKYTAMNITKFKNFADSNYYEMKEIYTRNKFLLDNELYAYNYAEPYSVVQPSNKEINGFDYSYFALRLCAFFITVYIVVLAAGTIAGEQSAGTLKLLAIRPFGRNKLLSAKIFATLAIGAILLFVSSVASLVIGGVTYGFNFTGILMIFNGEIASIMNPVILYFIAMILMFVEVAFYAMLAVFISTIFKSNVAAVSISTLIFFLSLVINVIAPNIPLLGLIPFVNVNFFKYFGSSFVAGMTDTKNPFQMILTPTVFSGSTFITSLILYSITFVAVAIVTHIIFKKRDIK